MNDYAWTGPVAAPLAIAVGILACFWGYRILKLSVGIAGFIAGAAGGWALASALAPANSGIALVCVLIGGVIGAALCLWLFFLGIFLLGASAGMVVGAAFFTGAGQQAQPLLLLILAVAFGVLALLMRRLMLIVSTAFSGSYLVTAGILHLVAAGQNAAPLWLAGAQPRLPSLLGYAALAFWLLLGLAGVRSQYQGSRRREQAARHEAQLA